MVNDKDSLEAKLADLLSKENIDRQVMASLLRNDSKEQLAGALFITSTLLNESLELIKRAMDRFGDESKHARMYEYFIDLTESHRKRGKKVLDAAKAGHEAVYGDSEEKQSRKNKIFQECLAVRKLHPDWGVTAIRDQAAENMGIGAKTIYRAFPNLKELLKEN